MENFTEMIRVDARVIREEENESAIPENRIWWLPVQTLFPVMSVIIRGTEESEMLILPKAALQWLHLWYPAQQHWHYKIIPE